MIGSAIFDATRRYRYVLMREWLFGEHTCVFIMLNPSTADEEVLDPTVRRCVDYAQRWGYKRLIVLNLFAWRSTDPSQLKVVEAPVGEENLHWIRSSAMRSDSRIVCAWGKDGRLFDQDRRVLEVLNGTALWCLGENQDGTPVHPLYQPKAAVLKAYLGR